MAKIKAHSLTGRITETLMLTAFRNEMLDCIEAVTVRSDGTVQVKIGSGSVIVEQSELDALIEALSELRRLAARDRALMNFGSA